MQPTTSNTSTATPAVPDSSEDHRDLVPSGDAPPHFLHVARSRASEERKRRQGGHRGVLLLAPLVLLIAMLPNQWFKAEGRRQSISAATPNPSSWYALVLALIVGCAIIAITSRSTKASISGAVLAGGATLLIWSTSPNFGGAREPMVSYYLSLIAAISLIAAFLVVNYIDWGHDT